MNIEWAYFYSEHWALFLLCLLLAVLACRFQRGHPWMVAVWLPATVTTGLFTVVCLEKFIEELEGDEVAIAMTIYSLLYTVPMVVSFGYLCFLCPPRESWRKGPVIAGAWLAMLAPAAITGWYVGARPLLELRVIDEKHAPLSGVMLWSLWEQVRLTESDGKIYTALPHIRRYEVSFLKPGYLRHRLLIERRGKSLAIAHFWCPHDQDAAIFVERFEVPFQQQPKLDIEMRVEAPAH